MLNEYKIAIIGSSGFLAKELFSAIADKKPVLSLGRHRPASVSDNNFIYLDLSKPLIKSPSSQAIKIDTVIFNAAFKGRFKEPSPEWSSQGQICAPDFDLLFKTLNFEVSRLITIGSSEEYGARDTDQLIKEDEQLNPQSSYGYWKVKLYEQGLKWSMQNSKDFIHLRPFNIYGVDADKNMFLRSLIETLLKDEKFTMTLGQQYRSFVHISVIVETILTLVDELRWEQFCRKNSLNVSSPFYFQLQEVAHIVHSLINKGSLNIGALPYRDEEVWHQKPDLTLLNKLIKRDLNLDFKKEMQELINAFSQ